MLHAREEMFFSVDLIVMEFGGIRCFLVACLRYLVRIDWGVGDRDQP